MLVVIPSLWMETSSCASFLSENLTFFDHVIVSALLIGQTICHVNACVLLIGQAILVFCHVIAGLNVILTAYASSLLKIGMYKL